MRARSLPIRSVFLCSLWLAAPVLPARCEGAGKALKIAGSVGLVAGVAAFDGRIHRNMPFFRSGRTGRAVGAEDIGRRGTFFEVLCRPEGALGTAGAFYLGGWAGDSERARKTGVMAAEAWAVNGVLVTGLKALIGRKRPDAENDPGQFRPASRWNSFPSGHASSAFAVAAVVSENYDSFWVSAAAYALAGLGGAGRVLQDEHWASDAVGGALLGYGSAKMVLALEKRKGWSRGLYVTPGGIRIVRKF